MRGQGCASARHASRPPTAWAPPPPLPRPPPELGHHCLRHAPLAFCLGQAALLARCALFAAARRAEGLHEAFGFPPGERPALAGLLLFSVLAAPLDEAAAAAGNALSRRFELAADRFAAELDHGRHGRHLRGALLHLEDRNKVCGVCVAGGGCGALEASSAACSHLPAARLGPPPPRRGACQASAPLPNRCTPPAQAALNVDPLYAAVNYSHPPLAERLAALDALMRDGDKKGD